LGLRLEDLKGKFLKALYEYEEKFENKS